jgi:hypothetical protein
MKAEHQRLHQKRPAFSLNSQSSAVALLKKSSFVAVAEKIQSHFLMHFYE